MHLHYEGRENRRIFFREEGEDWELSLKSIRVWRRRADSNRCIEAKRLKPPSDNDRQKTWKPRLFYFAHVTDCYRLSPEVGTFLERFFHQVVDPLLGCFKKISARLGPPVHASLQAEANVSRRRIYRLIAKRMHYSGWRSSIPDEASLNVV